MSTTVIYEKSMPSECAAAAFIEMMAPSRFTMRAQSRTDQDFTSLAPGHAVVLGTYWPDLSPDFEYFSFGKVLPHENITYADKETMFGPMRFAIELVRKVDVAPKAMIDFFTNTHERAINLIDERALGCNIIGTQVFFTGMANYFETCDEFTNFTKLFTNEVAFDDVLNAGEVIYASQVGLAAERARKNTKHITLKNGQKAVLTNAPELCNLTHEALRETYSRDHGGESPPVSVTFKFDLNADRICYSVRTYDGSDASAIVDGIAGAGGSAGAAGAHVDFELNTPF